MAGDGCAGSFVCVGRWRGRYSVGRRLDVDDVIVAAGSYRGSSFCATADGRFEAQEILAASRADLFVISLGDLDLHVSGQYFPWA